MLHFSTARLVVGNLFKGMIDVQILFTVVGGARAFEINPDTVVAVT